MKANPDEASQRLSIPWQIEPGVIRQANDRRSYRVQTVTREGLSEQQKIADAFRAEGLLPRPVDAATLAVWGPATR